MRDVYLRHRRYASYYPPTGDTVPREPAVSGKAVPMNPSLPYLVGAIGVFGFLLAVLLFARIIEVNRALKLKRHRASDAGVADLLNWAAVVDDGVIVGKNGSFMASWIYAGSDNASATEEQRNLVSLRINQALRGLGSGWIDPCRRGAPAGAKLFGTRPQSLRRPHHCGH